MKYTPFSFSQQNVSNVGLLEKFSLGGLEGQFTFKIYIYFEL